MKLSILAVMAMLMITANSWAQPYTQEKATKPTSKKTAAQVQEPACPQGDIKCEAVKEQNREEEPKDQATDKSTKKKVK